MGKSEYFEFKFNKMSRQERLHFLRVAAGLEFKYWGVVIDKANLYGPGFNYKEPFYKYTCQMALNNASRYLHLAKVTIDGSGDRAFRQSMEKYLKGRINSKDRTIERVQVKDSRKDNLLQLADMVVGALGRCFRGDKDDGALYRAAIRRCEAHVQLWPSPKG